LDLSKAISQKRCNIGGKLVLITIRKSYMSFRLVPKSVSLDVILTFSSCHRLPCHRLPSQPASRAIGSMLPTSLDRETESRVRHDGTPTILHNDIFFQDRCMLNEVGVKIKLIRSKNALCVMGAGKAVITHASLLVRKVSSCRRFF